MEMTMWYVLTILIVAFMIWHTLRYHRERRLISDFLRLRLRSQPLAFYRPEEIVKALPPRTANWYSVQMQLEKMWLRGIVDRIGVINEDHDELYAYRWKGGL